MHPSRTRAAAAANGLQADLQGGVKGPAGKVGPHAFRRCT
jgi:hypothetical protein